MPTPQRLTKRSTVFQDNLTCAFCHTSFRPGDLVVFCPRDKTIHHERCWSDNGDRCAVHQCECTEPVTPLRTWDRVLSWIPVGFVGVTGWIIALILGGVLFFNNQSSSAVTLPTPTPTLKASPTGPTPSPTPLPTPEFTIQPFDSQRDAEAQSIISLIPDWEGPQIPGEYQWYVDFPANKSARVSLGWCAVDEQTLNDNWPKLEYELFVDGYQIDLRELAAEDWERQDGDGKCRGYSGVLTGWSPGRHTYVWIHHIYQSVNDGWDTYESGDYIMEFIVEVN